MCVYIPVIGFWFILRVEGRIQSEWANNSEKDLVDKAHSFLAESSKLRLQTQKIVWLTNITR